MKRSLFCIVSLLMSLSFAFAQSLSTTEIDGLVAQQKSLYAKQDSLQSILNGSRSKIASATPEERDSLSTLIVSLEGSIFDVRAELGRVGNQLSDFTEQQALANLSEASHSSMQKNIKLYESDKINIAFSQKDLEILKGAAHVESKVEIASVKIDELYSSLISLKERYDSSMNQTEIDSIKVSALVLSDSIMTIDSQVAREWNDTYNHILGLYLIMLDSAPNVDRTMLENIENKSREVRRAESFVQRESLVPNLVAFDLQRGLLEMYEDAIAKSLRISGNYSVFEGLKLSGNVAECKAIEFGQKILTVYSPVLLNQTYDITSTDELKEVIFPPHGVYYTLQIALLSSPTQKLSMFRNVWPVQYQITPTGKYRYVIGGYSTYQEAYDDLATLRKAGFRQPTVCAFLDGEYISIKEAKKAEQLTPKSSQYKVVVTSENSADGDTVHSTMEMHAKDKNLSRIAAGSQFVFTVTQFDTKEEAEVFAQILRDKTPNAKIEVKDTNN